jgi:uncharacterized RDD family membrane protein YckC
MPMVDLMNAIAQVSAPTVSGPKLDNRRVLAAVVDLLIVGVGGAVILAAGDSLSGDRQGALSAVVLGWALYYYFALESGAGQTVGKKLLRLRVVRADGRPAGMGEIAVRTILRVVDGIGVYIVGLIVMLVTGERRQRIGDLAASTIVVDASAPAATVAPPAVPDPEVETVDALESEGDAELDGEVHADEPIGDEPVADEPVGDEPVADEPVIEAAEPTRTITLPSRPAPPATLADLATPTPEVPDEVEELTADVQDETQQLAPEVVAAEAAADVEEPAVEAEDLTHAVPIAEPDAEVEEPELPQMMSPSLEGLAADVAAAHDSREDEAAEEPAVDVEEPAEEPADDGPVTVKSVETVSAMDLIMGAAEENADEQDPAESGEDEGPATA